MGYLLLSISCATAILILFKLMARFGVSLFYAIVINYLTAFCFGLFLSGKSMAGAWLPYAVAVGILLITLFLLIGLSTQKAGISATTIATRMSVVIPVLFSIFFYKEPLGPIKMAGIVTALAAIGLTVIPGNHSPGGRARFWYLPVVLFGVGFLDTLMKLVQQEHLLGADPAGFTGAAFFFAFLTGAAACLLRRMTPAPFLSPKVLGTGILLGSINFGSIYFFLHALASAFPDSSVTFAVNSTGVVAASVFFGVVVFKERLTRLNTLGVLLALSAIVLLVLS